MPVSNNHGPRAPKPAVAFTAGVILALIVIGLAGVALRLYDLKVDAPALFADGSQDFTTDSGFLTLYAKNHALFGQWDLFDYEHWQTFKTSLITGTAALLYASFGVSLATSALTGTLLSLLGLIVLLFALSRSISPKATLCAAIFLTFNFVLILYAHFPFSENGLLLLSSLVVAAFLWRSDSIAMSAAIGALVAVAAFFGKAFGIVLLAGPIVWWLTLNQKNKFALIGTLIGTAAVGVLALSFLFHDRLELASFVWTHAAEEHLFPHGLSSPIGFFENLISYARTGLHKYTPFLSALTYLALFWLIFFRETDIKVRKVVTFMSAWLVTWIVLLSIFNYRPLRYEYILIVPMVVLASVWAVRAPEMSRRRKKPAWWQAVLLVLLNWYFVYHLVTPFTLTTLDLETYWRWVWLMLPVAIVVAAVELALVSRRTFQISQRVATGVTAAVIVLSLANDGRLYYHWISHRTYNISDANIDMADLLGPGAIISGQYGPAITQTSAIKNFPMFVTSPLGECADQIQKYGITHLALPSSIWRNLVSNDPHMKQVPIVARYWLRDNIVYVVPVWNLFGNATASQYQPTAYEKGVRAMFIVADTLPDVQLRTFLQTHPDSRSALIALHHWYAHTGNLAACAPLVGKLLELCPTDFSVQLLAAVYYKAQYKSSGDSSMMTKAKQCLDRAIFYNPVNTNVLQRKFEQSTPDMWEI